MNSQAVVCGTTTTHLHLGDMPSSSFMSRSSIKWYLLCQNIKLTYLLYVKEKKIPKNLVRKYSFLLFLDMLHDIGTEIGHPL